MFAALKNEHIITAPQSPFNSEHEVKIFTSSIGTDHLFKQP